VLVFALLLSACGGSKNSRPYSRGSSGGSSSSPASRRGGVDDIRKGQGSRYRSSSDSVPTDIPDVSKLPEPVPKVEPHSLYGNKSPYSVLGQTYNVLPSPRGYVERGIASFYGNKFHGYKTSSLEEYDMYQFSAAHKTLPLPSYARVTNLETGKSVIVRINDRGPFHENRIIDLSFAAAVKIGVWPKGTGLVEVRAIDPSEANSDRGAPYVNTAPKPSPVTAPPLPARVVGSPVPPSARTAPTPEVATAIRAPSGTMSTPVALEGGDDGPVAGMTGVSASEALPPLPTSTRSAAAVAPSPPSAPGPAYGSTGRLAPGVAVSGAASPAGPRYAGGATRPPSAAITVVPASALPPPPVATPAGGTASTSSAPAASATPSASAGSTVPGKPTIYLQVGAFSDAVNANRVADQLRHAGLGPISVIETAVGGRSVRRVRVGPLADVDTADRVTDQISGMGLPKPQVAVD